MRGGCAKSVQRTSFVGVLIVVGLWSTAANALPTWSVTTPPGYMYMLGKNANLSAAGKGPWNSSTVCDVFRTGVVYQSSTISTPPMGDDWATTMSPPTAGWPLGQNEVRTFLNGMVDEFNYFTSVNI